jgi:hypothetical protein
MVRRFWTASVTAFFGLSVAGCATGGLNDQNRHSGQWENASRAQVEDRIAESAKRATNAVETLVMIQRARTEPPPSSLDEGLLPEELRRRGTIEWSGPADALVSDIARNVGYGFTVVGNPPPVVPTVQISAKDQSAGKILENIGFQVSQFATIAVDPNSRHIELRYDKGVQTAIPTAAPAAEPQKTPPRRTRGARRA